jgi:lipopolysaccharide export system permease protein
MHTLPRHILFELLKVFAIALSGLTAIFLVGGIVREAMDRGLPLSQMGRLIPYVTLDVMRYTLPATLLLANTTVFARMAGGNEIVAIKALGISPLTIVMPALVMAFLVSLTNVWLNDVAVSIGRTGIQRIAIEAGEEIIYNMLRTQRSYNSGPFSINVKRVVGKRLLRVNITLPMSGSALPIRISAEEAELRTDPAAGVLKIVPRNFTVETPGKASYQNPDVDEFAYPLDFATKRDGDSSMPSWLPLHRIPEEIKKQEAAIEVFRQELTATTGFQMLTGDYGSLVNREEWRNRDAVLADMRTHLFRLQTEPHRRWSTGFSCLFFVWIGAPMAIRLRNGDFLTSFFLCFLPILVVYYPLMVYGVDGSKHGTIPPYSVWLGNLMLAIWGAYLLRKVIRY